MWNDAVVSKGTLENVLSAKNYATQSDIPTVNDATLTIQKNGTDVATFTANSATNQTANITVPTDTSDLTNGAGFVTSAAVPTKTSDLTNDSGFITNQVNNLANYYDQTAINSMFNALDIPSKTSDLTNDSGFLTSIPIASASTLGGVKIGSGINVAADGTIQLQTGDFLSFADFFFDGVVADYLVQSRINETRRKVAEAIRRVEELTAKLRAKYSYFN